VFPAPPVKVPLICGICSGMRLGSGASHVSSLFGCGLGLDEDSIVFLLVGTASVSSESDSSSGLSVLELAVCKC